MYTPYNDLNPMIAMGGTCIRTAAYDPYTLTLWIVFVDGDGTIYSFVGFPKAKWAQFKAAGSKGKYYHAFIKDQYQDS